jgi:hypothetical protein
MEMEASGVPRAGRESRGGGGEALLSAVNLAWDGWDGNGKDGLKANCVIFPRCSGFKFGFFINSLLKNGVA